MSSPAAIELAAFAADRDARSAPPWRSGRRLEHDITRKVLQHVGDLVEIIASIGAQPPLAVDVAGDPQIVGVGRLRPSSG